MFFKKAKRIKELEEQVLMLHQTIDEVISEYIMAETKYNALRAKHDDLHDKHWSECWQIGEYDNDLRRALEENRRLKARLEQLEAALTVDSYLND